MYLALQSPRELGIYLSGIHGALNWSPALNKIKLYINTCRQHTSIINKTSLVPKNLTKGNRALSKIFILS